jgi:hypothetical protein
MERPGHAYAIAMSGANPDFIFAAPAAKGSLANGKAPFFMMKDLPCMGM